MDVSPFGLMALTPGGVEWPIFGAKFTELNAILGPTNEGLRWKTAEIVAFARNTDRNRTTQYNLTTKVLTVLREAGWTVMYAGGGVVATFSNLGYWDSTGREGGNAHPVAVDNVTGSIAFLRENRDGLDVYVGPDRIRVFDGVGGIGACFRNRVLHFLHEKRMYRWSVDTRQLEGPLFTLPPWMFPICEFSGGWFLGWHGNIGGVVIWPGGDLAHGRIATEGIEAHSPHLMRVGDELHVLSSTGAGEFSHEAQRRILPMNDLDLWPAANLLDPNPPSPPDPPIPPIPPVETDDMMTLYANHMERFWEDPSKWVLKGGDGRYLQINLEWEIIWRTGVNHAGPGAIESDSAITWAGGPTATMVRNGCTERTFKVV